VLGGIGNIPGRCSAAWSSACRRHWRRLRFQCYEDVFAFGVLILILILRPSGLLAGSVAEV